MLAETVANKSSEGENLMISLENHATLIENNGGFSLGLRTTHLLYSVVYVKHSFARGLSAAIWQHQMNKANTNQTTAYLG